MNSIEALKVLIDYIHRRLPGEEKIDASEHNRILKTLVDTLLSASSKVFLGHAGPDTLPDAPGKDAFYLATRKGNYVHFGDLQINSPLALLIWNGQDWQKEEIEVEVNVDVNVGDYIDLSNYAKLSGDNTFNGNQEIIGSLEAGSTRGKLRPVAKQSRNMKDKQGVVYNASLDNLETVEKVPDSKLWDGNAFPDFLDQPVRRTDDVKFRSLQADDVKFRSLQTESYAPGLSGAGARIDEQGYAELTGLTLREFLEAPEYRFNRVDVVSGEQWNAPGFGLIESVDVENCIATLKLEDKELAGIQVGDLCRGLFHNLAGNADGAVTDSCGFLTVAGFSTSYFTPAELLEDGKSFRYELKPGTAVHPSPAMKFAVYGNFTDKSRQASAYSTRTYKRYLKEVNTWEIDPQRNIAMQFGDLSGLYINGVDMSGYSAWLNNIYFSGHAEWTPGQLEEIRGKDGYSVNLTSYDAVVSVDSRGRLDNSLYEIVNIVNGEELVQSAGMQVVTTRYKIQTEIQAYRGQVRLEHSDSPGEGMYTAAFTAEGCEYSFAAGVLTVTKITGDKASVEIEVNCEGAATFTMKFVLTRVYGGEAGPEGMISRVSEWAEGFYYRNDTETETGSLRYLDIVVVTDRSTGNFACYQAKAAHNGVASSELNRPGNEAFWTRMSQLPPIYTPLILAENGVIRFAQSNQLLIQKEDGTVTAGMSGTGTGAGGIRIWAGGSVPGSAPFRVDENGKMVADNADITGRITADSGKIGGFEIGDIYLESGGLRLSAGEIRYDADSVLIHMGTEFGEDHTLSCLYIKNDRVSTGAAIRMCAHFVGTGGNVSIGSHMYALEVTGKTTIKGETILDGKTTVTGALVGRGIGPAPHDMRHLVIDTNTGQIYHD